MLGAIVYAKLQYDNYGHIIPVVEFQMHLVTIIIHSGRSATFSVARIYIHAKLH